MTAAPALAPETRGALLLVAAVGCFATMDALAKQLMLDHHPLMVIWARYAGQVALVAALYARSLRAVARTGQPGLHALRACLVFTATMSGFFAFSRLPLAEVTAVFELAPLLVTALAALILGERVGPRRWTAVGVGFVGVLVVLRPGSAVFDPYALLALLGACAFAGYAVATRLVRAEEGHVTSLFYAASLGAALSTLLVPWVWRTPDLGGAAMMAAVVGVATLGQFALIAAFRTAPASAIAPFTYVGLLFAIIYGVALFGDVPDTWTLIGAAVIVGSGLYVWRRERQLAGD